MGCNASDEACQNHRKVGFLLAAHCGLFSEATRLLVVQLPTIDNLQRNERRIRGRIWKRHRHGVHRLRHCLCEYFVPR